MKSIVQIRKDFPIFDIQRSDKPFVYLDSTATALKPKSVIDAEVEYYTRFTANVYRGIYRISEEATKRYERARKEIADFVHSDPSEIIFTRNASESLNLVMYSWGSEHLGKGDEIATTIMEHHSNFVPWQQLAQTKQGALKIIGLTESYELDYQELERTITKKTKILALTAVSNVLGSIVDIQKVVRIARAINPSIVIVVDGAQSVPHFPVDVRSLGVDFLAFSGHKMLGPTGIGILWGRTDILNEMKPFQFGGDMIREVLVSGTSFNEIPHKFEAGTPNIAGAIGLGAAARYLSDIGMDAVRAHEMEITEYALNALDTINACTVYGPRDVMKKGGVIAFRLQGIHPHDIAQILDQDNVCVRVGFHCAQPLHDACIGGPTARASFYIYTDKKDIDVFVEGIRRVLKIFA